MRLYLNRMHRLDSSLCVAVSHTSQYRFIRDFFRVISRLGDGVFWYALMLGILIVKGAEGTLDVTRFTRQLRASNLQCFKHHRA